jgi:hypothetical protein
MPQFYQGNSLQSIGAPARVMVADRSDPLPTQLAHLFSLTTYLPNATYGFEDAGLTRTPTQIQYSADTNQWRNEQFGLYRTVPTDWRAQVSTDFLQITQDEKLLLESAASAATDPVTNEHRTNYVSQTAMRQVRVAVAYIDEFGLVHASVFPNCQWNGDAITQTIGRGEPISIPMNWTAYPDDLVIDVDTGLACFRYDLDQFAEPDHP